MKVRRYPITLIRRLAELKEPDVSSADAVETVKKSRSSKPSKTSEDNG